MPVNSLFAVSACCGCGTTVDGRCMDPGQMFDDFSIERDGWIPGNYWAAYSVSTNERIDFESSKDADLDLPPVAPNMELYFFTIPYVPTFANLVLYSRMRNTPYGDAWALEQEADITLGANDRCPAGLFIADAFIIYFYHTGHPINRIYWRVIESDETSHLGQEAAPTNATYNLKVNLSENGPPIGKTRVVFSIDDVEIHSDDYQFTYRDCLYHGILGGNGVGSPYTSHADNYSITIAVPASGPIEDPDDTVLFRNLLPNLSFQPQPTKTPSKSLPWLLLPAMSEHVTIT